MRKLGVTLVLMAVLSACAAEEPSTPLASAPATDAGPSFSDPTTIDNAFLPLTKFSECTLEGAEGDTEIKVVRTLTDDTKQITWDGRTVEAVVMRDREWEDGELVEETHDWFAQSDDGTVYYFGEAVDNYEEGKVADHEGSWELGKDTDNAGVLMPAEPAVGDKWKPEDVDGVTVENAEIVEEGLELRVGDETYTDVIKVRESHDDEVEFKYYARGTGEVRAENPDSGTTVDLVGCEK